MSTYFGFDVARLESIHSDYDAMLDGCLEALEAADPHGSAAPALALVMDHLLETHGWLLDSLRGYYNALGQTPLIWACEGVNAP
jgi:hypothetical protein